MHLSARLLTLAFLVVVAVRRRLGVIARYMHLYARLLTLSVVVAGQRRLGSIAR